MDDIGGMVMVLIVVDIDESSARMVCGILISAGRITYHDCRSLFLARDTGLGVRITAVCPATDVRTTGQRKVNGLVTGPSS